MSPNSVPGALRVDEARGAEPDVQDENEQSLLRLFLGDEDEHCLKKNNGQDEPSDVDVESPPGQIIALPIGRIFQDLPVLDRGWP